MFPSPFFVGLCLLLNANYNSISKIVNGLIEAKGCIRNPLVEDRKLLRYQLTYVAHRIAVT